MNNEPRGLRAYVERPTTQLSTPRRTPRRLSNGQDPGAPQGREEMGGVRRSGAGGGVGTGYK